MKKLRDRYAEALGRLGYRRVEGRTAKYWTFTKDGYGHVFLGKSGAVRTGRNSSSSTACSSKFKRMLLDFAAEKELEAKEVVNSVVDG